MIGRHQKFTINLMYETSLAESEADVSEDVGMKEDDDQTEI